MNKLEAYKMDGLGNDFVIFDNRKKSISLTKDQIIKISDRSNIGCDQVIFIDKDEKDNPFLKFYNSDGGKISACGNGSRCVAYLLMSENNTKKILLKTEVGILHSELKDKNFKIYTSYLTILLISSISFFIVFFSLNFSFATL